MPIDERLYVMANDIYKMGILDDFNYRYVYNSDVNYSKCLDDYIGSIIDLMDWLAELIISREVDSCITPHECRKMDFFKHNYSNYEHGAILEILRKLAGYLNQKTGEILACLPAPRYTWIEYVKGYRNI